MDYELNSVILMNDKFESFDYEIPSSTNASCKDEVKALASDKAWSIAKDVLQLDDMRVYHESDGIVSVENCDTNMVVARVFYTPETIELNESDSTLTEDMEYVYYVAKNLRTEGQVGDVFIKSLENIINSAYDSRC